jgi:hypothetical protein
VSLGETSSQEIAASKLIKDNELHRTLTILEHNEARKDTNDIGESSLVVSKVSIYVMIWLRRR